MQHVVLCDPETPSLLCLLLGLNCIWNEVESLSYILLTCSNCAAQHSDKCVPLVGVRVVGVGHPSLSDRLNQVYLLQSAVQLTDFDLLE
jgi:hypothetical protein